MERLPPPPLFPGIAVTQEGSKALHPMDADDRHVLEAALDCMAVARFQGEDLAGLSTASLHMVGWMDIDDLHLPLTGIASYWPSPAHGRLSTDSQALKRLGQALEPWLGHPLEAKPLDTSDAADLARNVDQRVLLRRTYTLPLTLSAHDRLAARAWLDSIGA